jgi:V/A-type H+-transporting ATPase subunit A
MYCVPAKQIRLLEIIMDFYERSKLCSKLGTPLYRIMTLTARGDEGETAAVSGAAEEPETGPADAGTDVPGAAAATAATAARPLRERLSRLKSEVKNDDLKAFAEFEQDMIGALERLERSYRNKEQLL